MTSETKKKIHLDKKSYMPLLKLCAVVFLAFLAGLTFRQSVGIIAMTPLAFVFCAASAFIGTNSSVKYISFGVTVFWLNTVENKNIKTVLVYAALCLLACIVFEFAAKDIKGRKKRGFSVLTAGFLGCIILSFVFIGNPFTAIKAKNEIQNYTRSEYPDSENSFFGSFEFSDIYYNYSERTYTVDAKSSKFPTEGAPITYTGGVVRDGFYDIAESKAAEPYVLEFTELLRHSFPSDGFSVRFDRFTFLPDENLFSDDESKLYGNIDYQITLNGIQSVPEFFKRIDRYLDAISESGIDYSSIVFKTGTSARNGIWFSRSVTIDRNFRKDFSEYEFRLVPSGSTKFYGEYFSEFTALQ